MGQMDAVTELEVAAARRREIVSEERGDVLRARRQAEQLDDRRSLAWLATAVSAAVARTPLARG